MKRDLKATIEVSTGTRSGFLAVLAAALLFAFSVPAQAAPEHHFLPALSHTGMGLACGDVVDSNGNLYVASYSGTISVFDQTGALITTTAASESCGLAVDSVGNLYVNSWQGAVNLLIPSEFPPTPTTTYSAGVEVASGANYAVAVNPANDHVLISKGERIAEYKSAAEGSDLLSESIGEGVSGARYFGVDIDASTGDVYANDGNNGSKVYVFDAASLSGTPAVTIDGKETPDEDFGFGSLGSQLAVDQSNGHVYVFDVSNTVIDEFDASGAYVTQIKHPFTDGEPSDLAVDNSGSPNEGTLYFAGLDNLDAFGLVYLLIHDDKATFITDTSARLEAVIEPNGKETSYQFEYLSEAAYQANGESFSGPEAAIKVPVSPASVGSDLDPVHVSHEIGSLTPNTAYRLRVVASNPTETNERPVTVFKTQALPAFAGLPDGRVYEQVTPIDKNGGDAQGNINMVQAARDGSGITFYSLAGFPGAEGAQDLPILLSSRSPSGWSTQSLYPPASLGPFAFIRGWSEDLSDAYVTSEAAEASSQTLHQRDNATRSLREIASLDPAFPVFLTGASVDGSVVAFESKDELLPNAIEAKSNVYVWEKASGDLRLASVLNGPDEGVSPPEGGFAGPYDWFVGNNIEAGGSRGNYYTQPHHAISDDGKAVYFTAAGSGKLYLRKNPAEPQSPLDGEGKCTDAELACTIEVSATKKTNGPGGSDGAGSQPAAFMAATPDGSKAFFTSSEELTNDANTGPDPEAPRIGRADLDGENPDLDFIPQVRGEAIDVDATHVYWVDTKANSIGRAKLDGSQVEKDFITGADSPQGVAVDDTYVYWTNAHDGEKGTGTIGRAKLDGTDVEQSFISGAGNPNGIDVDATHIYWANKNFENPNPGPDKAIGRAKLDGTDVEQSFFFEVADGDVAVSPTHVYYSFQSANVGVVRRRPLDLSSEDENVVVVSSKTKAPGIALDGSHLYFTNPEAGSIGRANLDGTDPEQDLIPSAGSPQSLAVDGSHIYWSSSPPVIAKSGKDLYRYDTNTGELTDIAPDESSANGAEIRGVLGISDDGNHVYFVANGVLTNAPNSSGETASTGNCSEGKSSTGMCNLYYWHEGNVDFIARLDASNKNGQSDSLNWQPGSFVGAGANTQNTARVSADGETLLFQSKRQLTAYDNQDTSQLYRYDSLEGLDCVSCNPSGAPPRGAVALRSISVQTEVDKDTTLTRNLSADGNRVFFESPDPLVAGDVNGEGGCPGFTSGNSSAWVCQDVYLWEAKGTGSCDSEAQNGGCLYLLSTGTSPNASYFADASLSGDDAFIFTNSQLVGQDKDNLLDIYDAKIGGGLSSQNPLPPPVPCEGEGCKAGATPPPITPSPTTSNFSGPGNQKSVHKRKRRQSKKRRQAKKQHSGKRHHKKSKKQRRQARKHR